MKEKSGGTFFIWESFWFGEFGGVFLSTWNFGVFWITIVKFRIFGRQIILKKEKLQNFRFFEETLRNFIFCEKKLQKFEVFFGKLYNSILKASNFDYLPKVSDRAFSDTPKNNQNYTKTHLHQLF
jgi:hypothetical protein